MIEAKRVTSPSVESSWTMKCQNHSIWGQRLCRWSEFFPHLELRAPRALENQNGWKVYMYSYIASNKILLWGLPDFASCWNSCGNCQSKTCVVRRFTFIFWYFVFSATSSNVHPAQLTLSPTYNHQTKYENIFFKKWLWPPIIICKNSCNSFKMWQCDWKYSNTHVMTSLFFWLKVGIFFTLEE